MKKTRKILVIGAGVSGLTTAICLQESGFKVVIVAEKFAPNFVSNVAGALWEWPPAACGKHGTGRSLQRSKLWCMTSYEKFKTLQATLGSKATGIYLRNITFYFHEALEDLPEDLGKMNELAAKVDDFQRGIEIMSSAVDAAFQKKIKDAYRHMAPTVDTDVYMQWLFSQAKSLGCEIIKQRITLNLITHEQMLLDRFQCAAIVNCAALGSIEIANDASMFPLRGALVRVKDMQGIIDGAHCIPHKDASNDEQSMIFIVPRGEKNTVILGGLVQMHQWGEAMSLDDPIIRQMYEGCLNFLPALRSLPLDEREPVRTGLRPFTEANVCVEQVPGTHLFYNYGHGGAGVTLSWGCAKEITQRVQKLLQQDATQRAFAGVSIDPQKLTVFLLQDKLQIKTDFSFFHKHDCNLVLLCSREGLSKIVPAQFQHIDRVQLVESYHLSSLLTALNQVKHFFKLTSEKCRVITNDEFSVYLTAKMRRAIDLTGDTPEQILPFVNKLALRQALNGSDVRMPEGIIFEPKTNQSTQQDHLTQIIETLDFPIFAKPIIGAGSEKTTRIHDKNALMAWCTKHNNSDEQFELCEFIQGTLYNTSLIIINNEITYFAPCKHSRPNDEFLHGKPIGNIIVRQQDPEYAVLVEFSLNVLKSLPTGYPPNGVINLDFFIDDKTCAPVLLEIASRAPGGLVSKMFDAYQGIALDEWHFRLQMGLSSELVLKAKQEQKYSAYCLHPKREGIVTNIETPMFNSDTELTWQICPGQKLSNAKSIRDAALGIFLCNDNWDALQEDFEAANSRCYFKTD